MVKNEKKDKIIGTLAPVFSIITQNLPKEDQGTFEAGMYFLDWLHKTGQNAWQFLPINETQLENGSPTKHVPSPYKGYGVGLSPQFLSTAYAKRKPTRAEKNSFLAQHKEWLEDYALFCTIRDVYGSDNWTIWEKPLRNRQKGAMQEWAKNHKAQLDYYITMQWQLHQSYADLHAHAKRLGISLIGDFPYYLSMHSPLVWAHQNAFYINKDGSLPYVSGIPNTATTHFGRQVWGHPLYLWEDREEVLSLWKLRLRYQAKLFETIRFDHAKAFFAYGVMFPENEEKDHYTDGPGKIVLAELFDYGQDCGLRIFAEDAGDKTSELQIYLHSHNIPGIKMYLFAMKPNEQCINPEYGNIRSYPTNCVAYTTTHDTITLLGYIQSLSDEQKKVLAAADRFVYAKDDTILARNIRKAIINCPAEIVIIPIQDWLLTTARINTPGTEKEKDDPNWRYVLEKPVEDLPSSLV